jgi:hypothetical protein
MKPAILFLLFTLAVAMSPVTATAGCEDEDVNQEHRAEDLRAFYAAHVRPVLRPERRLPNGTAWRPIVDSVTGIAEARVTWMADRAAMQKANRLLEAMHGCAILNHYGAIVGSFDAMKDPRFEGALQVFTTSDSYRQPPEKVLVSYASPRLVGTFRVSVLTAPLSSHPDYLLRSALLDLQHEKVVDVQACNNAWSDDPDVIAQLRIEGLIEICSDADQHAFDALWRNYATAARAAAIARHEKPCVPEDDHRGNRYADLYVTAPGLAVYTGYLWPRPYRECMVEDTPANPVVIPWRDLEPFLKPGPWRDELLKR